MIERIQKIMKEEGLSPSQLAAEIGATSANISHILSGRNKQPSLTIITQLLERFKWINAEWLLLGKGIMYKTINTVHEGNENQNHHGKKTNTYYQQKLFEDILPDINKGENNLQNENTHNLQNESTTSYIVDNKEITKDKEVKIEDKKIDNLGEKVKIEDKKIEKLIILYTDKTFETYNHLYR